MTPDFIKARRCPKMSGGILRLVISSIESLETSGIVATQRY